MGVAYFQYEWFSPRRMGTYTTAPRMRWWPYLIEHDCKRSVSVGTKLSFGVICIHQSVPESVDVLGISLWCSCPFGSLDERGCHIWQLRVVDLRRTSVIPPTPHLPSACSMAPAQSVLKAEREKKLKSVLCKCCSSLPSYYN
jgi:hypothetical protein